MSENEKKLIKMVREHSSPASALTVAIAVISDFLAQRGSSQAPVAVDPQEQA